LGIGVVVAAIAEGKVQYGERDIIDFYGGFGEGDNGMMCVNGARLVNGHKATWVG